MKEEVGKRLKELGVEEELINLKGMTQGMLVILGQKNIKRLINSKNDTKLSRYHSF